MTLTELLFGILSFFTHVIEAITGFGSTALSLPFAITITGVAVAVPVLTVHAWLLAAYVVVSDFKRIQWRQFLIAMAFILLGMPLGMLAFTYLPESLLKAVLAVFMIAVSIDGIRSLLQKTPPAGLPEGRRRFIYYVLLFLGGVVHGAFSSGGPLIIVYIMRTIREKSHFRATMCAFWFVLNLIILTRNTVTGVITAEVVRMSLVTLPFLLAGVFVGTWVHRKVPQRHFLFMVYVVLLFSGCFMAYTSFPQIIS